VIYVSHRLDEVFTIGDRVTVLRVGRLVGTWGLRELNEDKLVSLMLGGEKLRPSHDRTFGGMHDVALDVRQLRGVEVDNLDIQARRGEGVGIAGLTGSGREELLPLLFGVASRGGEVRVDGQAVSADPRGAM